MAAREPSHCQARLLSLSGADRFPGIKSELLSAVVMGVAAEPGQGNA